MKRAGKRTLYATVTALGLAAPTAALAQLATAEPTSTAKTGVATASSAPKSGAAKPPKGGASTGDATNTSAAAPDAGVASAGAPGASNQAAPPNSGVNEGVNESQRGELPAGHPGTGQLPAGHPSVGANPHAGGAERQELNGLFEPPEDTVQNDANLSPGVLVVTIQDADGKPVPGAPIDLNILRSSVAKGDSRDRVTKNADAQGSFTFDHLEIGAGTSYGISVSRGGGVFSMPSFQLGAEAGKRATLHVYDVTPEVGSLPIGMQGIVFVQLRQDALSIEQLFQVFNLGRAAWQPDTTVALPAGYKAFNKPDSMEEVRFDEVKGTGVALRGTVSPGRHDLNFRYQVPLDEMERQTIRIELPPRMAQVRVIAEASKSMTLNVGGFPTSQRAQGRDGKKVLITEKKATRAEGGFKILEITLGGLPTPSPGRWVALGLAGVTVLGAAVHTFRRRDELDVDDDARKELFEARDALLDEFVELERAKKRGDVGPKTYSRVRNALLDALARIVGMIEAAPSAEKVVRNERRDSSPKQRSAAAPRS